LAYSEGWAIFIDPHFLVMLILRLGAVLTLRR
jgi:hypothetical protein